MRVRGRGEPAWRLPRRDRGQPLPGLEVAIEDGEIVVQGPTVMDGYLHGEAAPRRWRTGDAGSLDADGFLTVYGRLDNLIVTPYGRNLSPEWIETMLLGDPRIGACVLCQAGDPARLTVLLVPSRLGEGWFKTAQEEEIAARDFPGLRAGPGLRAPANERRSFRARKRRRWGCSRRTAGRGAPRFKDYLQDKAATFEVQA